MDTLETPLLSVVVVPLGGRGDLADCLSALRRQENPPPFEVLVPYDEANSDAARLRESLREVRFLPASGRHTYAELRAIGVEAARGAIIALTEDHCRPDPGWTREIARAHEAGHAAVGGPVEKSSPASAVSWALYLSDFGRYMAPVREGPSAWITDCNSSYKRLALETIRPLWSREFHETTVNWTLQSRGETLHISPGMVVHVCRSLPLREALADRYAFGRLFAATRVAAVARWKRAVYAGLWWLVPAVRIGRAGANVLRKRRRFAEFLRALPALVLLDTAWAFGELVGTVTGAPGPSLRAGPR